MKQQKFSDLFNRYLDGKASEREKALVEAYLDGLEKGPVKSRTPEQMQAISVDVLKKIHPALHSPKQKLVHMYVRWQVAASVIFCLPITVLLFQADYKNLPTATKTTAPATQDVPAPTINTATITFTDGRTASLDSFSKGQMLIQENTRLIKLADGQIAYQNLGKGQSEVLQYNTLFNPPGSSVVSLTLQDGSKVWLNSGSSIRFPVTFVGNERKVTIDGEAYFEVAENTSKPFIVEKEMMQVEVLGTHFNVNAYRDESDVCVTLLQGSVKVSNHRAQKLLKPNQQARITKDIRVVPQVDAEDVIAWKSGIFLLNNTDVKTLLRQIARWYNVQIVYETAPPELRLGGGISKDQPLSKILSLLETYGISCHLEGRVLTVKQPE